MKAEALYRLGQNTDEALRLVNLVRTRSNCAPFTELSLDKIEKERAREFIWENQRRKDMIRFGSFLQRRHSMLMAIPIRPKLSILFRPSR